MLLCPPMTAFLHRHALPISAPRQGSGPSWDYEEGITVSGWHRDCHACGGPLDAKPCGRVRQCPRCGWWVVADEDSWMGPSAVPVEPSERPKAEVVTAGWRPVPIRALVGLNWVDGEPTGVRVCQDLGVELDRYRSRS